MLLQEQSVQEIFQSLDMLSYQVFLHPPAHFTPSMEAAGCYCRWTDRLLLIKRQSNKSQANKWGVPGGKLEKDENPLQAVIREMREEVGVSLTSENVFKVKTLYVRLPSSDYIYHMFYTYLSDLPLIILALEENQEFRWSTLQEALQLPLVAAGKEALLYYKNFLSQ
jgi:8-oxo-dGTP diphosphatase